MRQMAAPSGRPPQPRAAVATDGNKGGYPPRPTPFTRAKSYGAIDLGTNNCRLLIARPQDGELVVIDAFSRIVRLGEGLHGSGRISDAAIDRAVAALSRSEEHTSELQSLMPISYAVFCLTKKKQHKTKS